MNVDYFGLFISLGFIIYGLWVVYSYPKRYSIKVKGKCIYSRFGYHTIINHFSYVIDGKQYEGKGRCCWPKRKGKIYNIRVNKDNLEDCMSVPMMFTFLEMGLLVLYRSLNIIW